MNEIGKQAGQMMDFQSTPIVRVASQGCSPVAPHMNVPTIRSQLEVLRCLCCCCCLVTVETTLSSPIVVTAMSDILFKVATETTLGRFATTCPLDAEPTGLCLAPVPVGLALLSCPCYPATCCTWLCWW